MTAKRKRIQEAINEMNYVIQRETNWTYIRNSALEEIWSDLWGLEQKAKLMRNITESDKEDNSTIFSDLVKSLDELRSRVSKGMDETDEGEEDEYED